MNGRAELGTGDEVPQRMRRGCSKTRATAARTLLAEMYGWFTEGFDTRDLVAAKALRQEL